VTQDAAHHTAVLLRTQPIGRQCGSFHTSLPSSGDASPRACVACPIARWSYVVYVREGARVRHECSIPVCECDVRPLWAGATNPDRHTVGHSNDVSAQPNLARSVRHSCQTSTDAAFSGRSAGPSLGHSQTNATTPV